MGRFSCRFLSRYFAATVVWVVSVVGFRVVVLRQPSYGSFQLSVSESLFCGNRRMGRFSCRFPSRCFCGNRRMGHFSCRFPSRRFAATVVWVVSVVGFRGGCFAATVVWVISVVGFRVVVLWQPSYGSFQLSISESLFCGNRRMGRFSYRFQSRCFAVTVVWVVSVVDFRVVALRQPSYGSFQLSISESLFCGNRRVGRFSCRFPSRCFAATVVWVVSVVGSESLFCGKRRMGRFSCRFPSRCFAATVVWVVSVVDFRVVVLQQPSFGLFQLSVSESLF